MKWPTVPISGIRALVRLTCALTLLLVACVGPQMIADRPAPVSFLCRYTLNPYYLPDGDLQLRGGGPAIATISNARAAGTTITLPFGAASQAPGSSSPRAG